MIRQEKAEEAVTEAEFLKSYQPEAYQSPSVTVDILIFTMDREKKLKLLLIRRGGHPCRNCWAIPGGFVQIDEALEDAAARELFEETGLKDIYLEQLYTFGAVDRDARKRVISVAYMALVPSGKLAVTAGDDAAAAALFDVVRRGDAFELYQEQSGLTVRPEELAFDHGDIVRTALERLKGKADYTDIALELLGDKSRFSIYELQMIYESLTGEKADIANYRRSFKKKYIDTGRVEKLEEKCTEYSKKPSSCYRLIGESSGI